jgi:hypothetical protein
MMVIRRQWVRLPGLAVQGQDPQELHETFNFAGQGGLSAQGQLKPS